ncbi:Gfo/Idh/MocA family protein [Puniceibacterium sp. IMCC21224]|uniref:Gfo/Idh/MocA family protein n=1 Tax=Puniceibacterium sp. IMCC21224 TaxID=1618204 RepID=UPI00064D95C2|nr:Gfo/Idh/MocA family oxidoreductase [Puniceibacterium sp. IMCC21224]KMK66793.1 putative dehydrogenase [Puniceibacterium sp. IMCC21224]
MSDHIRWGILGASKFAREKMGPALHLACGGALEALATSEPAKAAPFADFAPGLRVHNDYDALLADSGIDAIYIPLPNHLHVPWIKKAVAAGKHVLCEKPIAMQAPEIDELIALRDSSGLLVAEAFMIVHHPQWQTARQMYRDGAIGRLIGVDASFSFSNVDPANIRNQAETGGGGLRDIGVYIFGATRFVTDEEPQEILSTDVEWTNGVDTRAHLTARFPSFHYTGMVSTRMAPRQEVVFHGDVGVMRLTTPFNAQAYGMAQIVLEAPGFRTETLRFPSDNQYVHQVEAFNRSVRRKETYPCPLEFSRGTQAMMDMVFDHAK